VRLTEGRLGALAERPFRLLWLGHTTSAVGDALIPLALAFAVIDLGGGASGLGLVLASLTLSRVAFILVGGVWADRLPRRLVMIACDVVRAAVDAFTAVALLTGAMELWMFVVTAGIFGAASAFFGPASTGLVPQTISAGRLQQANALLMLTRSSTQIFGPAAAGVLVALSAPGWVFALDALSFVGSAGFLLVLRLPALAPPPRRRFLAELAEGWREAWSRGWLRVGFLAAAAANVGIAFFTVLGPVIAEDDLGGAAGWGLVLTGGAVGGVAGSALALKLRPERPLVWCFAAWALGVLPALALVPPLPVLAVAVAFGAFLLGIQYGNAVWESVLQREVPVERLSRVGAIDWMISLVFMPLGQALAGPLADAVGTEATLVGAALLIAASCAAGLVAPSVVAMRAAPVAADASRRAA
jgi:MFS family permease